MGAKIVRLVIVAASMFILIGCPRSARKAQVLTDLSNAGVIINYTLVNRCTTIRFPNGPGVTVGGRDYIFLIYTIDSIQNEGPRAEDYTFSPQRLFVPTDLANRGISGSQEPLHTTLMVPAHTTQTNVGWVVMRYATNNPDAVNSAPGTQLSLRYEEQRGEQPVLIVPSARHAPILNYQSCNPAVLPAGRQFE